MRKNILINPTTGPSSTEPSNLMISTSSCFWLKYFFATLTYLDAILFLLFHSLDFKGSYETIADAFSSRKEDISKQVNDAVNDIINDVKLNGDK